MLYIIPAKPTPIRSAALTGIVTATPEEAIKLLVDVLKGDEPTMQAIAISLVRQIPGTKATQAVAAELPNLSAAGQVQLLSALCKSTSAASERAMQLTGWPSCWAIGVLTPP